MSTEDLDLERKTYRLAAPERVMGLIKDYLRQRGMRDIRLDRLVRGGDEATGVGSDLDVEVGYAGGEVQVRVRKPEEGVEWTEYKISNESRIDELLGNLDGWLN